MTSREWNAQGCPPVTTVGDIPAEARSGLHIDSELFITDIPRECVADCSTGGVDAYPAVSEWVDRLDFSVNRENAIDCLEPYGAWEREELEAESDREIAIKILWLACGNFSEWYTEADAAGITEDMEGITDLSVVPEDFQPKCGFDVFCLE